MAQNERDVKAFGPPHMRMVELAISDVVVDPAFNCRAHTPEEIAEACETFEAQPMLHAPTVARVDEEWRLVAGFLRFAVWQVRQIPVGLFRWIDTSDMGELLITNLAENIKRRELRAHEVVEAFTRLRDHGFDAVEIAKRCHCSARHVRRLLALKRDAHPELWDAFVGGVSRHLTLQRMLDLADHRAEEQLRRLRRMLDAGEKADEVARGYPNAIEETASESPSAAPSRRRLPTRRRAARALRTIEREPSLAPEYRRGLLDAFAWFLRGGQDSPFHVSVTGARPAESAAPAEVAVGTDEHDAPAAHETSTDPSVLEHRESTGYREGGQ